MDDLSELSSPPATRPSSPLSMLSQSPSPPPDDISALLSPSRDSPMAYPSPPASQHTSQSGSPTPDGMESSSPIIVCSSGPPPAKRRRISKESSKERTTEHLNLSGNKLDPEQRVQLDRLLHVLHKKRKIVVVAGAGISVSAGIPDFRSSQGLFRSLKDDYKLKGSGKDLFDASVYKDDSSTSSFHDMISSMSRMTKDAKPTPFHHMLATIASEGRLLRLYSQNVDGIDTSLDPLNTTVPLRKLESGKWPKTVQLHGGLDKMVCSKCHELSDFDPSLFDGPMPPPCPECVNHDNIRTQFEGKRSHGIGRLRPRMVLYNEHNPDDLAIGAVTQEDLRKRPDAVIVVGTTLKVPGVRRIVREMCGVVRDRRGGTTIWINNDPPPVSKDLEDCWDIVVQGKCDEVAKQAAMRRWDEKSVSDTFSEISEEDAKRAASVTLCPSIPTPSPRFVRTEALPSLQHRNNSFLPPPDGFSTPRKNRERGPTPSPFTSRRFSVVQSIENAISEPVDSTMSLDTENSSTSAYPTPTKSKRNTKVPKSTLDVSKFTSNKTSITKALNGAQTGRALQKSNNKGIKKPSQSKTKGKINTSAKRSAPLTKTFKQSKGASTATEDIKLKKTLSSPSKLRQTDVAEPMHTISPLDRRNNGLPLPATDVMQAYGAKQFSNPMRISSVINP